MVSIVIMPAQHTLPRNPGSKHKAIKNSTGSMAGIWLPSIYYLPFFWTVFVDFFGAALALVLAGLSTWAAE